MLEQHYHQLLLDHFLKHYDQFSTRNQPMFDPQPLPPLANEHDPSSYVASPTSFATTYGAHSPTQVHSLHTNSQLYSPENSSVTNALTIGHDFQGAHHINQWSTLASENSIIESMNRATPYSPEEKRERIERYRSKRTLRNFNKKIKYECRKTLADSRPRVRGRFARNDEIEKTSQISGWDHHPYVEEDDHNSINDYNWIGLLDAFATNLMP